MTNQLSQKESIKDCIREKFSAYLLKMREIRKGKRTAWEDLKDKSPVFGML